MSQINIGVQEIAIGAIASDGGMGTTLAPLGYTEEGSAAINWDDATETEFRVEEVDVPIHVESTPGNISLAFSVSNPDEDTLVAVMGGTKTGTGEDTVYDYPLTSVSIERSIKFTPKKGLGINIPRAKITAKFSSEVGRAALLKVEVSGRILQPIKANTAPFSTFRV